MKRNERILIIFFLISLIVIVLSSGFHLDFGGVTGFVTGVDSGNATTSTITGEELFRNFTTSVPGNTTSTSVTTTTTGGGGGAPPGGTTTVQTTTSVNTTTTVSNTTTSSTTTIVTTSVTTTTIFALPNNSIGIDNYTKNVGDVFAVNVTVNSNYGVYALQFDLGYNKTILGFLNITNSTYLSRGARTHWFNITHDSYMTYAETRLNASNGVNGKDVVAIAFFRALQKGLSRLDLNNVYVSDENASEIFLDVINGSVLVE
ncbi:MAG: cohesin domain-containing protein [Candidatus Aenigmatarchaeota archaeon]